MAEDTSLTSVHKQIYWYEEVFPIRGCNLSLENIKQLYSDLQIINNSLRQKIVENLPHDPSMSDVAWKRYKDDLLDDAFRLTIIVGGLGRKQHSGESVQVLDNPDLPTPIKFIHITNIPAYKRHANGIEPSHRIMVLIDFNKPELFDPNPLVSAATPNQGSFTIRSDDITFFNSAQKSVEDKLLSNKTWYSAIHRSFAYDVGMWFIAIPISLYLCTYYMDRIIPQGSEYSIYRWPTFIYLFGLSLLFYKAIVAYTKWAFPVNILKENHDKAWRHRIILGAFATWLLYEVLSFAYSTFIL